MNKLTLSAISDTRWVCRHKNCKAVIENFSSIVEVLNHEVEEDNDRDVSRAIGELVWNTYITTILKHYIVTGILATIQKTEFVVNLHVMHFALGIINILSNKLQIKTETLGHAASTIVGVIETFEDNRNSVYFSDLWKLIEGFSYKQNIKLELPNTSIVKLIYLLNKFFLN